MSVEARLKQMGIELPAVSPPVANYVNAVRTGNMVFLAGKGPQSTQGLRPMGKVGREFTLEQGYEFARSAGLELLAALKAELGSLDRVKRVVKVLGMVNCTPEFADQPKVINGCSDLLVEVFGERGQHARSAVGVNALPVGIPVEVEAIVEIVPARRAKAAGIRAHAKAARKRAHGAAGH